MMKNQNLKQVSGIQSSLDQYDLILNFNSLKMLFDSCSVGISLWDKELRCVSLNKVLAEINGLPIDSYIGKTISEVLPNIGEDVIQAIKRVSATSQPIIGQKASLVSDEKPNVARTWSVNYYPLINESETVCVWALWEEVTENKGGETSLSESESLFYQFAENMRDVFWLIDYPSFKVRYVSPTYEKLYGISCKEVYNNHDRWIEALEQEDRERYINSLKDAAVNGGFNETYRVVLPDGSIRSIHNKGFPIKTNTGGIAYIAIITEDITEHIKAEKEREQFFEREKLARQEAEAANNLKDEFLATLSHELRTPLTATLGWARMLRAGQLDAQATAHALESIERNTHIQKQLIEDLLDVSRIITGKLRLEVRPLMLDTIIQSAINTILPTAEIKDVKINTSFDSGTGPVYADPRRIQQVIWNLLSNAIKFTPKNGIVEVTLKRVNSAVEVAVKDTGIGIQPDFLPNVFERFRQADGATTRKHGGLGLGLAIVRHLIELHGGQVRAESEGRGKGATFTFTLPLLNLNVEPVVEVKQYPGTGELPRITFAQAPRLDDLHLLVVDDDQDNLDLLKLLLNRYGAKVRTASSAFEAFELLKQKPPDVLISDIGMPGEDGYELITKIRALPTERGGKVPAIALTAYAKKEDREHALSVGFQSHIPKPVEPAELVKEISSLAQIKIR